MIVCKFQANAMFVNMYILNKNIFIYEKEFVVHKLVHCFSVQNSVSWSAGAITQPFESFRQRSLQTNGLRRRGTFPRLTCARANVLHQQVKRYKKKKNDKDDQGNNSCADMGKSLIKLKLTLGLCFSTVKTQLTS